MADSSRPTAIPRGTSHGDVAACRAGWQAVANARLFDMGGSLEDGASKHTLSRLSSITFNIRKYNSGSLAAVRPVPRCGPGFLTFLTGADKMGRATLPQRGKTLETETLVAAWRPLAMDCAELGMMPILVL
jgi:hypothetical protein